MCGDLDEVSGLANAATGSVFAHNDEFGIVYEIYVETGEIERAFALGETTERGDFEGVAVVDDRIYLLTSDGKIYESAIGGHGERVAFHVYDTGLGQYCEFEGLAVDEGEFLLLCKYSAPSLPDHAINIFRWRLGQMPYPIAVASDDQTGDKEPRENNAAPVPSLTIPLTQLPSAAGVGIEKKDTDKARDRKKNSRKFLPSAIDVAANGNLLVLSARSHQIIEVTSQGDIIRASQLSRTTHPQAEGLTVLADGRFIIADEGRRTGRGRLTIYAQWPGEPILIPTVIQ